MGKSSAALWGCLIPLYSVISCSVFIGYLSINVFVNNSVGPELLGSANGVAMTFSTVGRTIAPTLCGSIYAWSLKEIKHVRGNVNPIGFPFNQFFVFFVLSLFCISIAIAAAFVPEKMNKKKVGT